MSGFMWDLDVVGGRIGTQHGVPVAVEHTGGGVATLFIGAKGRRLAVGPGWFHGTMTFADPSDLSMAPESQDADPVSLAEVRDIHDLTGRIYDAYSNLPTAPTTDRPGMCTSAKGLECTNPEHDHRSGCGEMTCKDCGAALFYCQRTDTYWHTDPTAPACFLVAARS